MIGRGEAGKVRRGMVRFGGERYVQAWCGMVRLAGFVLSGSVQVRYGKAGMVRRGKAVLGRAR